MKNPARFKNLVLSGALLLLYLVTHIISLFNSQPIDLLNLIATVGVLTGVTLFLSWMPSAYYAAIVLFACAAQYFGMMFDFYHTFWWYDIIVHFFSGILLSSLGYFLFRLLTKKIEAVFPIAIPVLFAVFFAIACAGLWEIYEYCADTFFGLQSQSSAVQSAIDDTMQDIIAGTLSAICYGAGLAFCLRRKNSE